jgi:hypothetical protein
MKKSALPNHVTRAAMARLLALSPQRIGQLVSASTLPQPSAAGHPLTATVQAYVAFLRARRDAPTLIAARRAKLEKENELLDLNIAARMGRLISVDEAAARLRPMLVAARQKVLACSMTDDEKDALLTEMGNLLEHALSPEWNGKPGAQLSVAKGGP